MLRYYGLAYGVITGSMFVCALYFGLALMRAGGVLDGGGAGGVFADHAAFISLAAVSFALALFAAYMLAVICSLSRRMIHSKLLSDAQNRALVTHLYTGLFDAGVDTSVQEKLLRLTQGTADLRSHFRQGGASDAAALASHIRDVRKLDRRRRRSGGIFERAVQRLDNLTEVVAHYPDFLKEFYEHYCNRDMDLPAAFVVAFFVSFLFGVAAFSVL